jgi:restriction endonuclease S subunit
MASITRVQFTNLDLSARIDAEHYSPRFTPLLRLLERSRTVKLRRTLYEPVKTGHTPSTKNSSYYNVEVVKFVKTDNLREDRIDTFDIQFLSEFGNTQISASELRRDDVIVTIIGATEEIIGRAARVHADLGRANINQNIALIRSKIPAGYLTVFLNSHYGREQLIWLSRQTGQVNLNCREVEELEIPLFSDDFISGIHSLNSTCHALLVDSSKTYKQAEQLLLTELDLLYWKPAHALTYSRCYSKTSQAQRIDAEHFHPKYSELRECIRSYPNGFLKLTDITKNSDETIEPHALPDKEFKYVELADINQVIGTIESVNTIKGKDAPSRARMLLRRGDVIASTVEGSLDKVALVSDNHDGAIGSTGFFVLRPQNVPSGYLIALAKSIIVREQMRCESSGTILAAVPGKSLRNIIVPNIQPDKRDEIAKLVQHSHASRQVAIALLEKAKRAVEMAIEEGEDSAIAFIR